MNNKLSGQIQVILATFLIAKSFIATVNISAQLYLLSLNLMCFTIAAMVLTAFFIQREYLAA